MSGLDVVAALRNPTGGTGFEHLTLPALALLSTVFLAGSVPCRAVALESCAGSLESSWRADKLIASGTVRSPSLPHEASCAQAVSITQRPRS